LNKQVEISSAEVRVTLKGGVPVGYKMLDPEAFFEGAVRILKPQVHVYKITDNQILKSPAVKLELLNAYEDEANYQGAVFDEKVPVASFRLKYVIDQNIFRITVTEVIESDSYLLMHVEFPELISGSAKNSTKLVLPVSGQASLVDSAKASPKRVRLHRSMQLGMLYNSGGLGLLESVSIENVLTGETFDWESARYGTLGAFLLHRAEATAPERMFRLQDFMRVNITFIGDYDGDGEISWMDGGRYVRDKVNVTPNPLYCNAIVKKVWVDAFDLPKPSATFAQVLDLVKRIYYLTNGARQIIHLIGWQYDGLDTGWPAVDRVNERCGGKDSMLDLMRKARRYNANITFHDDHDIYLLESPGFDLDLVAIDNTGKIQYQGTWGWGICYRNSFFRYAPKQGRDRVKYTVREFGIEDTCHIDYYYPRGPDYNPRCPATTSDDQLARLMLVDEYNTNGIDISIESFSKYFVGHVSWFLKGVESSPSPEGSFFEGEKMIPLTSFIYHGKVLYGGDAMSYQRNQPLPKVLTSLINGGGMGLPDYSVDWPSEWIADNHCLVTIPCWHLSRRLMECVTIDGSRWRADYDSHTWVEVDWDKDEYEVHIDGHLVAKNYQTLIPIPADTNTCVAYSRPTGRLRFPVLTRWPSLSVVRITELADTGLGQVRKARVKDGHLEFAVASGVPYLVQLEKDLEEV